MAFKREIDDTRDSLAFKLRKLLTVPRGSRARLGRVRLRPELRLRSSNSLPRATSSCSGPRTTRIGALDLPPEKVVVDVWGFFGGRVPVPRGGYDHPVVAPRPR